MSSTSNRPAAPSLISQMLSMMDPWPQSWAGSPTDIHFGEGLARAMRPFVEHLGSLRLTPKTIRRHLDACWVIGGEVIRRLYDEPKLRNQQPRAVLLDTIAHGEAPLVHGASETQQRRLDATARRLQSFLASQTSAHP